jgi:NADH-quinone oxidoreductase subunit N
MTWMDAAAILPLWVLAGTSLVILLEVCVRRHHGLAFGTTVAGLVGTAATIPVSLGMAPRRVTALLAVDTFALFFIGFFAVVSAIVAIFAWDYLDRRDVAREEFYALLLIGTLGSSVLACSTHFASFFLGLEILSVSLYGLIAYLRHRRRDIEAGLKYLILAAAASAFLIFGIALLYAESGSLAFDGISATQSGESLFSLVTVGLTLVVVGVGFKLALVPFHVWTPDVYQGAPAPVTAFIATVSKGGVLAVLLRLLEYVTEPGGAILAVFAGIAIVSMIVGNLLALMQENLERLLAYSSIAHLGYLFTAALALGDTGARAAMYYLVAYSVTILGAFGIISLLSSSEGEPEYIDDYRGLFWERPGLAAVMAVMMFSLAGIPLTAGFLGKLYVLLAGIGGGVWGLAVALVIGSAIGLFYYLRVIVAMFSTPVAPADREFELRRIPAVGQVVLALLVVALVVLGVYPMPLLAVLQAAV